jgi:hypothetical protein
MCGVDTGETDTTLMTTMRPQTPVCPGRISRPYKTSPIALAEDPPPPGPSSSTSDALPRYPPVTRRSPVLQFALPRCISHLPQSLLSSLFWPRPPHLRHNPAPRSLYPREVTYTNEMALSISISSGDILPPPLRESGLMRT